MATESANAKIEIALSSIQPIRDLARNWDVDIASYLDDYLEDIVGHLSVAEGYDKDASSEIPNFAHAAMLLHNSSNVYSRKVEYLYTLVYNALENFATSNQSSNRVNKKKVDAEIQEFEQFDPQVQFLLLDDVIPTDATNQKIDLPSTFNQRESLDFNPQVPLSASRLSLGGTMSATVLDRSAAAAAATVGFLTAAEGSLSILNQQTENGENGLYRMRGTASLNERNRKNRQSSFDATSNGLNLTMDMEVDDYQPTDNDQPILTDDQPIPMDEGDGVDGYGAEDDNDGPGFHMADENDDFHPSQRDLTFDQVQQKTKKPSAWALLDPHDAGVTKGRPLRVGKNFHLPPGLDKLPSECVTGARTKPKTRQSYQPPLKLKQSGPVHIATTTFKATISRQARDESSTTDESIVEHPAIEFNKGLAYGEEFAYIAKATAKRKAAERRERRKILQADPTSVVPQQPDDEIMGYDDGGFDYGGDDDSFGGGDGDADFANGDDAQLFGDEPTSDAATFEALCRAQIQEFRRGAEKYKAETNLIRRVTDWQSSLAPLLEEEERRPEFDIHSYGKYVLTEIQKTISKRKPDKLKPEKSVTFQDVTKSKEKYDICRLFLASLKLSEFGNVRFNAEEGILMTPDTLEIEMLNSDFKLALDSYIAPSAM